MSCSRFARIFFVCAGPFVVAEGRADELTFERDIRPIFRAHCYDCHGAEAELKGGLDLRLVRFMMKGGETGPAIVPGDAGASYLMQRVRDANNKWSDQTNTRMLQSIPQVLVNVHVPVHIMYSV